MKYKLIQDTASVYKLDDNNNITQCVPADEANTDYQEYLEWVAEGNTPEPADEV